MVVKTARLVFVLIAFGGLGCAGASLGGGTGGSGTGGSTGFGGDGPCNIYYGDGCKTGLGGSPGTGGITVDGGNGTVCVQLAEKYSATLSAAAACTPGAPDQCQAIVANVPAGCPTTLCNEQSYVNDAASVEAVRQSWVGEGCGPAIGCLLFRCDPPPAAVCVPVPSTGTSTSTGKTADVGICVPMGADGGLSGGAASDAG
jgi:hypothetical protein